LQNERLYPKYIVGLQNLSNSFQDLSNQFGKWNLANRNVSSTSNVETIKGIHLNGIISNMNSFKQNKFHFASLPMGNQKGLRLQNDAIPDYPELMDQQISSQLLGPSHQAKV
jgi:hypothetical protein